MTISFQSRVCLAGIRSGASKLVGDLRKPKASMQGREHVSIGVIYTIARKIQVARKKFLKTKYLGKEFLLTGATWRLSISGRVR
jgi:hypothetical protein